MTTSSTSTAPVSTNLNPTPTCLGTASSGGGGTLTQGGVLPSVTTTQKGATSAPSFYMNQLNQMATCAQNAAGKALSNGAPGAQPLQTLAFQNATNNAGNYQPELNSAQATANSAAGSCISSMAQKYMNPYVNCVVNSIGNLGQNNINSVLAPQATAGIIGSGQFGSQRGAGALGSVLANAEQGITAQQGCALQKGYTQALCSANKQVINQINAAKTQGCLATAQNNLNIACSKNLAALGCQQYKLAQNQAMFPLCVLKAEGCAIRGFNIPTATSCIKTGPLPGAYATSPLATATGVASTLAGALSTDAGKAFLSSIKCTSKSLYDYLTSTQPGAIGSGSLDQGTKSGGCTGCQYCGTT